MTNTPPKPPVAPKKKRPPTLAQRRAMAKKADPKALKVATRLRKDGVFV